MVAPARRATTAARWSVVSAVQLGATVARTVVARTRPATGRSSTVGRRDVTIAANAVASSWFGDDAMVLVDIVEHEEGILPGEGVGERPDGIGSRFDAGRDAHLGRQSGDVDDREVGKADEPGDAPDPPA